jgi:signal transduction histidine kinase
MMVSRREGVRVTRVSVCASVRLSSPAGAAGVGEAQPDGVSVRVADRGPGVAPQHLRQIWQPFYRAERELTRTHKGTGIGLALVRGLVERMGGEVTGRNTNPGFEVRVSLPLRGG